MQFENNLQKLAKERQKSAIELSAVTWWTVRGRWTANVQFATMQNWVVAQDLSPQARIPVAMGDDKETLGNAGIFGIELYSYWISTSSDKCDMRRETKVWSVDGSRLRVLLD